MTPRNVNQNKQIQDERRKQILKAALQVFARRGFSGAKISDIATEAKLSHGLVYHYFKSKDDLFIELVKEALAGSTAAIMMTDNLPGSAYNKIKIMTELMVSAFSKDDEPSYFFYLMLQAATLDSVPAQVKELLKQESVTVSKLATLISQGQIDGEISDGDPVMMSITFWSFLEGLVLTKIQMGDLYMFPNAEIVLRVIKK